MGVGCRGGEPAGQRQGPKERGCLAAPTSRDPSALLSSLHPTALLSGGGLRAWPHLCCPGGGSLGPPSLYTQHRGPLRAPQPWPRGCSLSLGVEVLWGALPAGAGPGRASLLCPIHKPRGWGLLLGCFLKQGVGAEAAGTCFRGQGSWGPAPPHHLPPGQTSGWG